MKKDLKAIFEAALEEVRPEKKNPKKVRLKENKLKIGDNLDLDLNNFEKIIFLGAGKASAAMAKALEGILGDLVTDGLVIVKDGHGMQTKKIRIKEAAHPVPDLRCVEASKEMLALIGKYKSLKTLFLFLLSGGASSLFTLPAAGITLQDKQKTTEVLLNSGADIKEINILRKHLSRVKGGRLMEIIYPATVVSLVISDVIGDDLSSIGSGPLYPDESTWTDCLQIIQKYGLEDKLPSRVIFRIRKGLRGEIKDTPKSEEKYFQKSSHFILASNKQALKGAFNKALQLGYNSMILTSFLEGEAKEVAKVLASIVKDIVLNDNPLVKPACLLSGGETTITLTPPVGKGGRNQELALAFALEINYENLVFASLGTDGTDGPTNACGALVSLETLKQAEKKGIDVRKFLQHHDAYTFFQEVEGLVITGPTYTNVMDIQIALIR